MTPPPSTSPSPSLALADTSELIRTRDDKPDALLGEIINGSLGPLCRLADTVDLTLGQVSDWIMHPHNRQQVSNLVALLDAQTQLMICQHRLLAVTRLAEVATSATSPETVRRACSDLLKIRLIDPYKEDKRPEKMPPPPDLDQDEIRSLFQQLGAQSDDDRPQQVPPSPPLSNHAQDPDRFADAPTSARQTPAPADPSGAKDSFSQNEDSAGMKSTTGAHRRAQTKPSSNHSADSHHHNNHGSRAAKSRPPTGHPPPTSRSS